MEKRYRYKQLSEDVISSPQNILYSRVASAKALERKLFDEDAEYRMTFKDIEIEMKKAGHFTTGILVMFVRENHESEEMVSESFIDLVISDILGTFISEWY